MGPFLAQADPFSSWLTQIKLTDLSFTLFVFIILVALIVILWRKILPFYIEKKWPADLALKEKIELAEIDRHKAEVEETRLMRQALERQNAVSEKLMLLIEQHDRGAATRDENMIALLRIVLDKQGVEPSQIASLLQTQTGDSAVDLVTKRLAEALKQSVEAKA